MKKKILTVLLIAVAVIFFILNCTACRELEENVHPSHPFILIVKNGSGWDSWATQVACDSFQMISKTEAAAYCNGAKLIVKGDEISPETK